MGKAQQPAALSVQQQWSLGCCLHRVTPAKNLQCSNNGGCIGATPTLGEAGWECSCNPSRVNRSVSCPILTAAGNVCVTTWFAISRSTLMDVALNPSYVRRSPANEVPWGQPAWPSLHSRYYACIGTSKTWRTPAQGCGYASIEDKKLPVLRMMLARKWDVTQLVAYVPSHLCDCRRIGGIGLSTCSIDRDFSSFRDAIASLTIPPC